MGNGTWHTDQRCETPGIGCDGVEENLLGFVTTKIWRTERSLHMAREEWQLPTYQPRAHWKLCTPPSGHQEQPESYLETVLCSPSTFLWGRPQYTHGGEELASWMDWVGAESLERDLFSPATCLLVFTYTHTFPPRCDAPIMTVMVHMTSLVPSTPAWLSCKEPQWVLAQGYWGGHRDYSPRNRGNTRQLPP